MQEYLKEENFVVISEGVKQDIFAVHRLIPIIKDYFSNSLEFPKSYLLQFSTNQFTVVFKGISQCLNIRVV